MYDSILRFPGFPSDRLPQNTRLTGRALTKLFPVGKVEINGEIFDAISLNGFIQAGDKVEVVHYQNDFTIVMKI